MSNSEDSSTGKECSRKGAKKIENVEELKGEPKDNHCHVYYIHRDGTTYCRPNREIDHETENDSTEIDGSPLRSDVSPTVHNEAQNIATAEITNDSPQIYSKGKAREIEQCADDRLILV